MEQLNCRVQIWMDQKDYVELKKALNATGEIGGLVDLEPLRRAVEEAYHNNSNYTIADED